MERAWEVFGKAENRAEYLIGIFYGKTVSEAIRKCRQRYFHETVGLRLWGREVL